MDLTNIFLSSSYEHRLEIVRGIRMRRELRTERALRAERKQLDLSSVQTGRVKKQKPTREQVLNNLQNLLNSDDL